LLAGIIFALAGIIFARRIARRRVRIDLVGALEFSAQLAAGGSRVGATCLRLVLQAFRVRCHSFSLGLRCAGLGCRLVGKRFALAHLVGLFDRFLADVARLYAAVFGAFLARHPRDCGDEQSCRDNNDDDPNDSAGSHVGSSDWLSMLIVEIGWN
jgi:hypothetical protein